MRQALELALEALTYIYTETTADEDELIDKAITAIKEALAQPEQDDGMCRACENDLCTAKQGCVALDNPPPQRTWVGLTDEESEDIWNRYCDEMGEASINDAPDIARAIESALRSKNT